MSPEFTEGRDWAEVFWSFVSRDGQPGYGGTPCWNWTRGKSEGYGCFTHDGKSERCHRLSWLLHSGDPSGKYVLHKCDNRACVNPLHLFLGTHADNMRDAAGKGRLVVPRPDNSGERNGRSKLTADKVRGIRKAAAERPELKQTEIGTMFGVSGVTVCRILAGKIWKGVQ